jgi:hypothetical protein
MPKKTSDIAFNKSMPTINLSDGLQVQFQAGQIAERDSTGKTVFVDSDTTLGNVILRGRDFFVAQFYKHEPFFRHYFNMEKEERKNLKGDLELADKIIEDAGKAKPTD